MIVSVSNYHDRFPIIIFIFISYLSEGALPGRFKENHFYNSGAVVEIILSAITPLLNEKFRKRVHTITFIQY